LMNAFINGEHLSEENLEGYLLKLEDDIENGKLCDDEIMTCAKMNYFEVPRFLLKMILQDSNETRLCSRAFRCLAFLGNVYLQLWVDFLCSSADCGFDSVLLAISSTTRLVDILEELVAVSTQLSAQQVKPVSYLGYDSRDIKDFNIEGYDLTIPISQRSVDTDLDIMTILLLLHQLYCHSSETLKNIIDNKGHYSVIIIMKLSNTVERLLLIAKSLSEDSYLQIIRIVAAINSHFNPSITDNQTEIANMFAKLESSTDYGLNISQV